MELNCKKFISERKFLFSLVILFPVALSGQNSCSGLGTITHEVWKNITGTSVSDIPLNTPPTSIGLLNKMEAPKDVSNNYGRRIRGYICPPSTGKYIFWIASDDKSELWLSNNSSDSARQLIAYVPGLTGSKQWTKYSSQQSAQIQLTAGHKYYIEALHKEGTNHDNLAVGWQLPNGVKERPIPGKRLAPFIINPPSTNVSYNQNLFAIIGDFGLSGSNEAAVATLVKSWKPEYIMTVGDNNYPDGAASTIDVNIGQYYHEYIHPYSGNYGNGSDTNRFLPALGNHDWTSSNAAPYFQYFTLPGNERYYDFVKGDVHFFWIDSDSRDPDGVSKTSSQAMWLKGKLAASSSKWKVVLCHHSPYASDDAGSQVWMRWPFKSWGADVLLSGHSHVYERIIIDNFTYIVNGAGGSSISSFANSPVAGTQLRYNATFGALQLKVSTDTLRFKYYNINNQLIDDFHIVKNGSFLPSLCSGTGTILREYWDSISGYDVSLIPVGTTPKSTSQLAVFEGPSNAGDNYGDRIRGYICPPVSGNYIFWIASDDQSELWLSPNDKESDKVKIASLSGFTSSREWTKYPSQQSVAISLLANNKYYIESLHKEATFGDNIAVGWQLPDQTLERPIPGFRLSPSLLITQPPQQQELIAANSLWKYLDNGTNQGIAWRAPSFNDSLWKTGQAELGYGDGNEATIVSYGSSSSSKYITTYFRKSFNVADTSGITSLALNIIRDDGAVVYLNGMEVYRTNMPSTSIYYNTLAPAYIDGTAETSWLMADISRASLMPGNNVIAVELHQNSPSSSDISFNLKLSLNFAGTFKVAGNLKWPASFSENDSIYYSKGDFIIYPNPSTGFFTMEYCNDDIIEQNIRVEVFNPIGQILFQKNLTIDNGCVIEGLQFEKDMPVGKYYLNVNADGNRESKQIILTR